MFLLHIQYVNVIQDVGKRFGYSKTLINIEADKILAELNVKGEIIKRKDVELEKKQAYIEKKTWKDKSTNFKLNYRRRLKFINSL